MGHAVRLYRRTMQTPSRVLGRTTTRILVVVRQLVAPLAGALFFVLWFVAEYNRHGDHPSPELFALLAVVIALSVWMPVVAMGLAVVVGVLQLVGLVAAPNENTWPAEAAVAFAVFFIAVFHRGLTRSLALPALAVCSVLFGVVTGVPTDARPSAWGSWTGSTGHPRQDALLLALGGFGVGVAAWLLGVLAAWILSLVGRDVERTGDELDRIDVELRLSEDRARISRDVHDALAHSLAVIVSQAQGAAALSATRPAVAGEALATVTDVARTALVDVRSLVERITGDDDTTAPRVSLDDVPALVESMRQVGMGITLAETGDAAAPLTEAQEVAVYRIVQESLTNALKHAGCDATVRVDMARDDTGLRLEVESSGAGPLVASTGRGIGIAGMTERARLAGGWLSAVRESGTGSFVVTAFVPAARGGEQNA